MAKNFDKYLNNINEEEVSPVEAALEASGNYAPKTKRLKLNPSELSENPKLNSLFEIKDDVLQKITESMKKNGFNEEEPITLWVNPENGKMEILDGHTRKIGAEKAGLKIVSCVVKNNIKTIEQAVEYAKNRQRNRRNLTPEELLR